MVDFENGISTEEFVKRVGRGNDGGAWPPFSVVEAWPFTDLPDASVYATQLGPETVVDVPDHTTALAIAKVSPCEPGTPLEIIYHRSAPPRTLRLDVEPEVNGALQELAGVNMALAIELRPDSEDRPDVRTTRITRVLGVEHPLLVPDKGGRFPTESGGRDRGYIQGTVRDNVVFDCPNYLTHVAVGLPYLGDATLVFQQANLIAKDGQPTDSLPRQDDQIRARVLRHPNNPKKFVQASYPMYVLNRNAGQNRG